MNELDSRTNNQQIDLLPPERPAQARAVAMLTQHAEAMQTAYELASRLVETDLVPARYRRKADDATAAILYGAEIGLNPIQSLQNVFAVNGSPAIYARTMGALLKSRGYRFRTVETSNTVVEIHGWAPGRDPDTTTPDETSRWTIEDAKKAGYTSNKKYESEPRAMLYAKALAEVCRHLAPDVLLGISYTLDEMEAAVVSRVSSTRPAPITVDEIFGQDTTDEADVDVDEDAAAEATDTTGDDMEEAVTVAATILTADEPDTLPLDEPEPEPISAPQLKKLSILLKENGFEDRDSRHQYVAAAIGRDITTAKDLTKSEASWVIDTLENTQEQEPRE